MCFFIKLGRHLNHDERMNPIDLYGNKLMDMIENNNLKLLCASSSYLADILTMVRGWILLILEINGQGHNRHH